MDKLEPYSYSELKEFNTAYLAGYIAEKYNYTDDDLFRGRRIKSAIILILISDPPSPGIRRLTLRMSRFRPIKSAAFTYCFRSGWSATTMSGLSTFCDERADGQGCRQTADQCRKSGRVVRRHNRRCVLALRLVSLMIGGGFNESTDEKACLFCFVLF